MTEISQQTNDRNVKKSRIRQTLNHKLAML